MGVVFSFPGTGNLSDCHDFPNTMECSSLVKFSKFLMLVYGVSIGNLKALMYWLFTEREPVSVNGICIISPRTCPSLPLQQYVAGQMLHTVIPVLHLSMRQLCTWRNRWVEKLFLPFSVEIWIDESKRTKKSNLLLKLRIIYWFRIIFILYFLIKVKCKVIWIILFSHFLIWMNHWKVKR